MSMNHQLSEQRYSSFSILIRVIILIGALLIALHAYADGTQGLARENRLIEKELSLAEKSNLYFVFDLQGKIIRIKAQGVILKEFPIHDVRVWGSSLPADSLVLIKKSTFVKPRRKSIKPAEHEETDNFEINALELGDMPSRYTLVLDKGVSLSVKPYKGLLSKSGNVASSLKNALVRPFRAFWYAVRGKPYTAVDIFLEVRDAKALYWSFQEGTESILFPEDSMEP
jgi:hypothetical protein